MTLSRRLKRQKREPAAKPDPEEALSAESLDNAARPMKRIFPFDFPGHNGDWLEKDSK